MAAMLEDLETEALWSATRLHLLVQSASCIMAATAKCSHVAVSCGVFSSAVQGLDDQVECSTVPQGGAFRSAEVPFPTVDNGVARSRRKFTRPAVLQAIAATRKFKSAIGPGDELVV